MKVRSLALALIALCAVVALGPVASASAQTAPAPAPMTKVVSMTGKAKNGKKFAGTFSIQRFAVRSGKVVAIGTLRGKLGSRSVYRRSVTIPASLARQEGAQVAQAGRTCRILTLTLGPLDLNLLGLRVQLNQVNLQITAIRGGGLLGDLLCAIAELLNPRATPLGNLAAVLNAILALVPRTAP